MTNKYKEHQPVMINTGYLKDMIFKVVEVSEDSSGYIYKLAGGKHQNLTTIWRYERELDPHNLTADVVSISAEIDSMSMDDWTSVSTAAANTTPSLYSFDELMSKIKHGKLEIGFI